MDACKISSRGAKLQAARTARGMSQSKLAAAAGISIRVLQDYERGARDISLAKLATMLKVCNALGCRLSDVVTDAETLAQLEKYSGQ